jgi:transcriptional regulator with XRE-family HTH domain
MSAKEFFHELEQSDEFAFEVAKLDFALELKRMMEGADVRKSDLAEKLGVSRPMVSKLLRGDSNLTIETMVRACKGVGGKLFVRIGRDSCDGRFLEVARASNARLIQMTKTEHMKANNSRRSVSAPVAEHIWEAPPIQAANDESESVAA